ncbi:amphiregulin-like [Kryptolebias marmoratus]|uniref:Amphiregulin n=1 Tax=Kryptolebias marmoratus TaxID=37003 RepID=A0A3Q2ZUF9_KRYMA|nr:amphiregulin-like [Kryptolebias marmoratus]
MNLLVIIYLLCIVVCSALDAQGSEATYSAELARGTGGLASGEGLVSSLIDDDELEVDKEHSGGHHEHVLIHGQHANKDEKKKRKGKSRSKNRQTRKFTTPQNPEHTLITRRYNSTVSITPNPCTSTHVDYCIHGDCKYIEGLQEPVCVCMKDFVGERCEIQTLGSVKPNLSSNTELVQTVLVVIAVVLSVISCCAVLLMTCAHYRSHKNFLASYLGTGSEQEKLQKPMGDIVV